MKIPKGSKTKKKQKTLSISELYDWIEVMVHVTSKDIENGEQGIPSTCAIDQSLMRQFGETNVSVHGSNDIKIDGFTAEPVTKNVQKFIDMFDEGKKVKPFSFKIKLKSNE